MKASNGGRTVWVTAGALVVAGLGYVVWIQANRTAPELSQSVTTGETPGQQAPTSAEAPVQEQATATAEPGVQAAEPDDQVVSAPAPSETPLEVILPEFDEVRREPDGMTVIAGRAAPGSTVQILQNGVEIGTGTADTSGQFAAFAMIMPDGKGHVLSLSQAVEGEEIASVSEVILAPLEPAASIDVAEAETPGTGIPPSAIVSEHETEATEPAASTAPTRDAAAKPETAQVTPDAETLPETEAVSAGDESTLVATVVEPAQVSVDPDAASGAGATPDQDAVEKVAVLKSTQEGVELLQPATPQDLSNVALDTIGYSEEGEVRLSGRAQGNAAEVRVYLDNDAVISLPVDAQGRWRGDVPDVDEGTYTLRVDEIDSDGTVTSRVETPFRRESVATLASASVGLEGPISAITVQKGATLWAIARDRYGDPLLYVRVFEVNRDSIRDPDLIYPGQVFDLPDQEGLNRPVSRP